MSREFKRAHPTQDQDFYAEWALSHDYCQFCGIGRAQAERERWPGLERHHVIKCGRSHEACNLLMACNRCHRLAELHSVRENGILLPKLPVAICLTVKRVREPEAWDAERLAELAHENLPDLVPIPDVIEAEFRRRRPHLKSRFFSGLDDLPLLSAG